ncbi:MAG: selenide, water dikinase SelD [Cyanobacteria bacterium P01_H01_bin.119]
MESFAPITKELVLLGGGHTHAIVLRKLAMQPIPGVQLTLVTDLVDTPYSGMLPCHISGLYSFDESHIDLRPLTRFANCRLVMDKAIELDLARRRIHCANHPPIDFDVLSIDTGSTPATLTVSGATYAVPAKPVPQLLRAWEEVIQQVRANPDRSVTIGIVGGGVAGVELSLCMQARLHQVLKDLGRSPDQVTFHLFHRGAELAKGRNAWTRAHLHALFQKRGIQMHLQESVCALRPALSSLGESGEPKKPDLGAAFSKPVVVDCESGLAITCDRVFWVTNASAPQWLQGSGLALTEDGFIQVNDALQSLSHPDVFAAGDVATMVNHPRPKAGVFAVRQGPPLFNNLQRYLKGESLKEFRPQKQFLNIIDTGTGTAIASRGPFCWESSLARRWKDRIDRKFMGLFNQFPEQPMARQTATPKPPDQPPSMLCAGCGAKVGRDRLTQTLKRLQQENTLANRADWPHSDTVLLGLESPDDAAVVRIPHGQVALQTVDYLSAIVDDPFIFGQICANHCLSDLFAMGATPQTALAIAVIPYATGTPQASLLYQLMAGVNHALIQVKTTLVGGHTTQGHALALGFACHGIAAPDEILRNSGMQPGDRLILTKPLGTGTLFAADMQLKAKGRWIAAAVDSMLQSNRAAARCLQQHQATACTDITGFGLIGHLLEMAQASEVRVFLDLRALPILPGARETASAGITSSLHSENLAAAGAIANRSVYAGHPEWPLLFDPQTSGGLLASVPSDRAQDCLNALSHLGYAESCIIGEVTNTDQQAMPLIINKW